MIVSITGFYTTPGYVIYLSKAMLDFLSAQTQKELAEQYLAMVVQAPEFEILLDTDGVSDAARVERKAINTSNQYLSYAFYLPYNKVVINQQNDLGIFVEQFLICLQLAIKNHTQVPEELFTRLKLEWAMEVNSHEKYIYKASPDQEAWRKAMDKFRNERK